MSFQLTPEVMAAAYELLRTTPPFKGWRLPPSTEVTFKVSRSPTASACIRVGPGVRPCIEVSARSVSTLLPLVMAMAHEMTHLNEHLSGDMRADCCHGYEYRRRAKRVCAVHRFDPMQFGGLECE